MSSSGSCLDPYDEAEKGLQNGLENPSSTNPPPEVKKILSFHSSLRSTDSTLVGFPSHQDNVHDTRRRLPDEGQQPCTTIWATRFFNRLPSLSFPRSVSQKSLGSPLKDYQAGYDQFQYNCYDTYPDGWPRVAAFLESCDSFSIYRRFGQSHSRLLVIHARNIAVLEAQIHNLDKRDDEGGPDMQFRLKNRYHEEGFDTTKRDLEVELEKELLAYDALLLNHQRLKSLDPTPNRDHDSVFRWIWQNQPLDKGEYDWIFHPGDFVSMVSPQRNRFEASIRRCLHSSNSFFKSFFKSASRVHETKDVLVEFYSQSRISTFARILAVFVAVSILFTPVIIFLLAPMSNACMSVVTLTFVLSFAVVISLLVEATFQEIFIGTATYCAVLVTFLGNLQGAIAR